MWEGRKRRCFGNCLRLTSFARTTAYFSNHGNCSVLLESCVALPKIIRAYWFWNLQWISVQKGLKAVANNYLLVWSDVFSSRLVAFLRANGLKFLKNIAFCKVGASVVFFNLHRPNTVPTESTESWIAIVNSAFFSKAELIAHSNILEWFLCWVKVN